MGFADTSFLQLDSLIHSRQKRNPTKQLKLQRLRGSKFRQGRRIRKKQRPKKRQQTAADCKEGEFYIIEVGQCVPTTTASPITPAPTTATTTTQSTNFVDKYTAWKRQWISFFQQMYG